VLTVGRQAPGDRGKGIDLLIQAMPRLLTSLPDVSLVVIGDGADRARLERMAHDLRVGEHIQFCGNVPVEALVAAYRRCDVFALPSRKEGFGLVFLEAMAFGKPVVGGAHGGTPDIIEDGVTGYLVRHGDVEQLAHVLERLLADDGLRKEMGRRAQEHVRRRYLFEDFERRLTAILESTLGEGLGQAAR
jgi:glycosyltransferase involved in cell wall biosynthesis